MEHSVKETSDMVTTFKEKDQHGVQIGQSLIACCDRTITKLRKKAVLLEEENIRIKHRGKDFVFSWKNAVVFGLKPMGIILPAQVEDRRSKRFQSMQCPLEVETELRMICRNILAIAAGNLLLSVLSSEDRALFYQTKAEYLPRLAKFLDLTNRKKIDQMSFDAYREAKEIAENELKPADPVRLGIALKFSQHHYAALSSPQTAFNVAEKALGDVYEVWDGVDDNEFDASKHIISELCDIALMCKSQNRK